MKFKKEANILRKDINIKLSKDKIDSLKDLLDDKKFKENSYKFGVINENSLRLLFRLDEIRGSSNVKKLRKQVVTSIHDFENQADKELKLLEGTLDELEQLIAIIFKQSLQNQNELNSKKSDQMDANDAHSKNDKNETPANESPKKLDNEESIEIPIEVVENKSKVIDDEDHVRSIDHSNDQAMADVGNDDKAESNDTLNDWRIGDHIQLEYEMKHVDMVYTYTLNYL